MPVSYYVLGGIIQFAITAILRFVNRFFQEELRRFNRKNAINVMLVGTGETARFVRRQIDDDPDSGEQIVCIFTYHDSEIGTLIDGVSVIGNLNQFTEHLGTKYIAEGAAQADAKLLYISTDYVFGGKGERPWMSDSADFAPLNVYGATKLAGEEAVRRTLKKYFIVRISWAFGLNGKNFVRTMINIGKTHKSVRVVNDQIGTPTYTRDLARLLGDMIETEKYGCYHATNEGGYISWCDFCREIYRQCGLNTEVIPVSTEEYGLSRAARPQNSRLDKSKLALNGFAPLPDWRDALSRYLEEAKAI